MKTYQQILAAAVPTIVALLFLSPWWIVLGFIVLGQGHFFISYLYQFRSGKMDSRYAWRYFAGICVILTFLFATHWSLPVLTLATAIIFEMHFVFDELFLAGVTFEPFLVFAVLPLFFLYPVSLSDKLLGTSLGDFAIVAALLCAAIFLLGTAWRKSISYGGLWMVFLGMTFLAVVKVFDVPVEKLLGSVILYHYFRWALFYGNKYWHTDRFAPYIRDLVLVHTLAVALFVWYWFFPGIGRTLLALLFTAMGFYVCTWLHIFSSIRLGNLQRLFYSFRG